MGRGARGRREETASLVRKTAGFIGETLISSVKALAEIFDFVAGLMQRVPKKPNEMKADLQNSTAILVKENLKEKEYG